MNRIIAGPVWCCTLLIYEKWIHDQWTLNIILNGKVTLYNFSLTPYLMRSCSTLKHFSLWTLIWMNIMQLIESFKLYLPFVLQNHFYSTFINSSVCFFCDEIYESICIFFIYYKISVNRQAHYTTIKVELNECFKCWETRNKRRKL